MIQNNSIAVVILLLLATGIGCSSSSSSTLASTPTPPAQGSRILGLDVKGVPVVGYATAYVQAMALGVREVSISLDWATFEPTVGNYTDTFATLPALDSFYLSYSGDVSLVLRPLDTPGPRLPTNLAGTAFNDSTVIDAFEKFLIYLHSQLPNLNASGKLKWIHVGNEIDSTLGSDANQWAQWQTFFNAAKTKIESLWGTNVIVGSVVQFSAISDTNIRTQYLKFLPSQDKAVLTYYPLNADFTMKAPSVVAADFDFMVSNIPTKPILLQECGYPSSTVNNSSELQQANFVTAVFNAWDTHKDRIELIDFAWQYDVDGATVDQWIIDFGLVGHPNENEFKQYLLTIGLSNNDGTEKPALQRLRDELLARTWVQ